MTTTVARRPSTAGRRAGYVIAIVINAVLLWLIHVSPGWDAVAFLTADFQRVLWLIDLSLVVTIAVNVLYLFRDPRRLTAAGSALTSAIGFAACVRILQVFPFDFGDSGFWPVVFRIALWIGIVGSAIAVVVGLVGVVRPRDLAR